MVEAVAATKPCQIMRGHAVERYGVQGKLWWEFLNPTGIKGLIISLCIPTK
jgi:hypothetical protein